MDKILNSNGINGDNLGFRLVGMGVRARYTGTELNRGGTMILARATRQGPVGFNTDGYQYQTLLDDQLSNQFPVSRTWRTIAWNPRTAQEYDFLKGASDWYPASTLAATYGADPLPGPDMIIAVSGGVVGNSFDYEIIGYYEYIGTDLDNVSKSESDLVGLSAVRNVTENQAVIPDSGTSYYEQIAGAISQIGSSSTSAAILTTLGNKVVNKLL